MAQLPGISDDRGSKPQKILFDMCCNIYSPHNVIWELQIPELNQRFDIFIKHIGVAIEYDGRQHSEYVQHFHKDECGYIASIKRDNTKHEWAVDNGISIIRFDDLNMPLSEDQLKRIVSDSIIESDYTFECFNPPVNKFLEESRSYRRDQYKKNKKMKKNK